MTQFYSRNDVNYSGDVYSIPFKYIHKKEVKVYIDDELWTKWHFLSTNQLTLDEVPEGIGYNNIVSVRRETDIKEKVVTYDNNSLLNKENLNKSQDQLIYAVQEIYDNNVQFQSDIREEVDEKVERVSDAVEKLEFLEDSVEIANEAALEATEQAQIATEKAEETLNTFNEAMTEIDTLRQDSIDEVNQLVADHTDDLNALDQLIKKDADAIINRVGFNMFDTVIKDHILTYEESKGLALQGTWVYKTAIAGERYGYADFYNKVVEESNNSTAYTEEWTQPTVTANTTTTTDGNIVCTASSQYSDAYGAWKVLNGNLSGTNAWASVTAVTKGWWQVKFPYKLKITGLTFYSSHGTDGNYVSKDCQFFTSADMTTPIGNAFVGSTVAFTPTQITGIPAEGVITDTIYLNITSSNSSGIGMGGLQITAEKVVVEGVKRNDNGHLFYDIADKDSVDAYFNTYGTAWFYGIDQENERIFLPRDNFFAVKGIAPVVGNGMTLGGTDGTNLFGFVNEPTSFVTARTGNYGTPIGTTMAGTALKPSTSFGITTDPTKSGIEAHIEANEDKYLYICVGNQVQNTSWVDVVTQVQGGVKDIEEAKDEAIDAMKNVAGGTVPLGFIGSAILGIDETLGLQRYLNGQIIIQDQFKGFTKFLKRRIELYPSLACTEEEWQTEVTMSAFSQCGKFVIDENAGTIRLPKVVNIQGLTDLSKLGQIVEAGLPNITGTVDAFDGSSTGAFKQTTSSGGTYGGSTTTHPVSSFNASLSNPIYGNSNTVQQEQIQYPYFIQVATGAETEDNIINEIELNNPFSLLDYKFSEYELNNLSWLRSNGQYNSKAIYPAVYDLLLKIYNGTETKAGVSVKLATETFTDYDFVLNTAEETFRLPIKVKLASGKAVVGNGKAITLTDGQLDLGTYTHKDSNGYWNIHTNLESLSADLGTITPIPGKGAWTNNSAVGLTTDPNYSGLELSDSDLYLYFYVGETIQNANLINAGRIEEIKANRSELDGNIVIKFAENDLGKKPGSGEIITISLDEYLPKDGNIYEVLISGGSAADYNSWVYMYLGSDLIENGPGKSGMYFMRAASFSSSRAGQVAGQCWLPVGLGRYITIYNTVNGTAPTSTVIIAHAYRKVR